MGGDLPRRGGWDRYGHSHDAARGAALSSRKPHTSKATKPGENRWVIQPVWPRPEALEDTSGRGLRGPRGTREGAPRMLRLRRATTSPASIRWTFWLGASEATADTGFMARLMMHCVPCPAPTQATQLQYKRVNGPYTLIVTAVGQTGLPYGNLSPPVAGLGLHRGGAHPIPRAVLGAFALRVYAQTGHGSDRGWQPGRAHPTPQPDEAALQRAYPVGLRR